MDSLRMLIHTIDIFMLVTHHHMQSGMLGADLNPALLTNVRVITRQYGIMSIVRKNLEGRTYNYQKGMAVLLKMMHQQQKY